MNKRNEVSEKNSRAALYKESYLGFGWQTLQVLEKSHTRGKSVSEVPTHLARSKDLGERKNVKKIGDYKPGIRFAHYHLFQEQRLESRIRKEETDVHKRSWCCYFPGDFIVNV